MTNYSEIGIFYILIDITEYFRVFPILSKYLRTNFMTLLFHFVYHEYTILNFDITEYLMKSHYFSEYTLRIMIQNIFFITLQKLHQEYTILFEEF